MTGSSMSAMPLKHLTLDTVTAQYILRAFSMYMGRTKLCDERVHQILEKQYLSVGFC